MVSLLPQPAGGHPLNDPASVGWSRLEFEASKLFVTARSEVELVMPGPAIVSQELLETADFDSLKPVDDTHLIGIRTTVLGQESQVRFLFDPKDSRALQRSELSISKKRQRHRTYRYASTAVYSRTLTPAEGEAERPFTEWSQIANKQIGLPLSLDPKAVITEAAALLYALPAGGLEKVGDETLLNVFSRGHVSSVLVRVEETPQVDVDYVEVSGGRERRVKGRVETLKFALRPQPLASGEENGRFKLLGLEGDIDLYLEPRSRAPLLVVGKIKIAGTVNLRARRVVLR